MDLKKLCEILEKDLVTIRDRGDCTPREDGQGCALEGCDGYLATCAYDTFQKIKQQIEELDLKEHVTELGGYAEGAKEEVPDISFDLGREVKLIGKPLKGFDIDVNYQVIFDLQEEKLNLEEQVRDYERALATQMAYCMQQHEKHTYPEGTRGRYIMDRINALEVALKAWWVYAQCAAEGLSARADKEFDKALELTIKYVKEYDL